MKTLSGDSATPNSVDCQAGILDQQADPRLPTTIRPASEYRQPYLHDLICTVRAPAVVLSAPDGQIRNAGVQGGYAGDRRVLSRFEVTLDGEEPAPGTSFPRGGNYTRYITIPRGLGDRGADPTVLLTRDRELTEDTWQETLTLTSFARAELKTTIVAQLGTDLSDIMSVKSGRAPHRQVQPSATADGLRWEEHDGSVVTVSTRPAPDVIDVESGRLEWATVLSARAEASIRFDIVAHNPAPPAVLAGPKHAVFARPTVVSPDPRLAALVEQSLADLTSLQLADPLDPRDVFLAAGAPWFLTLFGRDSIWAARMLLPLGTKLAGGTLRALARRQGRRTDVDTAEEPGKIPHEIRSSGLVHDQPGTATTPARSVGMMPLFYGTVDATPLWISLLHDAWEWGLPDAQVRALIEHLERALAWMRDHAIGPSGFLQYADTSGHGLANQGWKDSEDSVQFLDGSLATAPVALCEVQAYAYAAALHGATLLEAFGRPGAPEWRRFAHDLRERFRAAFWIDDPAGPYPAIAIDGTGRRVDTVTSNLGHLLGTGLLNEAETALVVARLADPSLTSGFGLRTMSTGADGYNPLAYHGGSVWTHDTAIAISGLRAVGTATADAAAANLISGLLAAASHFDYRMPEIFGGQSPIQSQAAVPYPAACRPQAWSAASAVVIIRALLGLDVGADGGIEAHPLHPSPVGPVALFGLPIGDMVVDVRADQYGRATVAAGE